MLFEIEIFAIKKVIIKIKIIKPFRYYMEKHHFMVNIKIFWWIYIRDSGID